MKTKNKKFPKWSIQDDPIKLTEEEISFLENYSSQKIDLADLVKVKKTKKRSKKAA